MNRKLTALVVGAIVAIAGFALWIPSVNAATAGCDSVAVIRCGVKSEADLLAKYDSNPNSAQTIYRAFGISRSDLNGFTSGTVYKDGRIVVNGKTVATGARTAGHNWGSGDRTRTRIAGTDAYIYSTSQLASDARPVMVKMVDGQFKFGVMNDCGNPVSATPVPVVKPPVETPKEVTPVYSCDKLAATKISRTKYSFTTSATAKDGASITGYKYDFGDSTTQHLGADGKAVDHDYAQPGTYTTSVTVEVSANNQAKTATSTACTVKVTVAPENTLEVCDMTSGSIVTINESAFDSTKYTKDLTKCNSIKVCDLSSKTIVTIKEGDFDSVKYTKDLTQCNVKVCQISTKTITSIAPTDVTSDYTTDLTKCETPVTPVTPTTPTTPAPAELPHTGISDVFSGSLGLGTLTGAGYYYAASRRALGKRL